MALKAIGAITATELLRTHDWSVTPLGPEEAWPQSLKTAVDMMMASGHAMCLSWGPEKTFLYNDAYVPIMGNRHPAGFGLSISAAWPDVWHEIEPLVERTFAGETVTFQDMPLLLTRFDYPEQTFWSFSYSPVRDESGKVAGLLNVTLETTEVMAARERQSLLAEELSHRLKNSLSIVQAIAHQTRGALGQGDAMGAFNERLRALTLANDLLSEQSHSAALLGDVARSALQLFGGEARFDLTGPDIELGPHSTLALSLLLHELATNATKYGSLSVADGRVELGWSVRDCAGDPWLMIRWRERGGLFMVAPTRKGFGSRLIRMGLHRASHVELDYASDGLVASFDTPLAEVQQGMTL